jgi:uncharacterized protein YjbI with pentapeptide repeats
MEIKDVFGNVLFALESAKTIAELARAAIKAKANLYRANLDGANLYRAHLYRANLNGANLYRANLYRANLYRANLDGANLDGANLDGANLDGANLDGANLDGAKNIPLIALAQLQFIPEIGAFIGWKKCANNTIVKLGISASAKRSHSTGRKCRCSKAKVLAIYDIDGNELQETCSLYDTSFSYHKGKLVIPANGFDDNRWNECAAGIHFFITRVEAENFNF